MSAKQGRERNDKALVNRPGDYPYLKMRRLDKLLEMVYHCFVCGVVTGWPSFATAHFLSNAMYICDRALDLIVTLVKKLDAATVKDLTV